MIDFSWYLFIGKTKLNLSFKETGRLTFRMFNKLYSHYKDNWSLEMRMAKANMTYGELEEKARQREDWF